MHTEPSRTEDPVLIRSESAAVAAVSAPPVPEPVPDVSGSPDEPDADVAAESPTPRNPSGGSVWARPSEDTAEDASNDEVERALLAREFSQLLQEDEGGADG